MANNVRRMALDIGPMVWAYIAFQLCVTLISDGLWLWRNDVALPLLPGLLLNIGTAFTAQKVALWRTLPVTQTEIDRARWWQSIMAPPLLLCAICISAAFAMAAVGLRHATWSHVAILVLGQSMASILFAGVSVSVFPFAARKLGRWSALLIIPVMLAIIYIAGTVGDPQTKLHKLLLAMDAAGLATAVALYTLAGHWPAPLTTPLWAMPMQDRSSPEPAAAKARGLRGWPVLIWGNLPTFVILWACAAWIPLAMKWFLPRLDLSMLGWLTCLAALQFSVYALATAMRNLRVLPFSGWQLTCRLVLLLLFVQAISLLIFKLVLLVSGEHELSTASFLLPLAYSLVYFPLALRLGLRLVQFGLALSIIFIMPIQLLASHPNAVPWMVICSLAVMGAGTGWIYWEITRSHRAYRIQPLVPARWRGF
jgi:hypothetical protein